MKNITFNKLNERFAYSGQFKIENLLPGLNGQSVGSSLTSIDFSGVTTFLLPAGTTLGGASLTALGTITSSSAQALAVGLNGLTNPAFNVDSSTASQAAGLNIIGATAAGTVAVAVISSGANASLTLDGKGTGTLGINTVSTTSGLVTIGNSTSVAGVAVNGPTAITSASATSFTVGRLGSTTPAFQVDSSTASQVAGLKVTGAATGGTVAIIATDSGANTTLTIDAKGTGVVTINGAAAAALGVNIGSTTAAAGTVLNVTSTNANALTVGRQGATSPAFLVNANAATSVTGVSVTSAASGGGVAVAAISLAAAESITFDAKGTGTLALGSTSTGLVIASRGARKVVIINNTLTALGSVQNTTPTAAQLLGGLISHTSVTGAGTATLDTGTNISSAISGVAVGDSFTCLYANIGTQTVTITTAAGLTLAGTAAVPTLKNALLTFYNTGANTWNVYITLSA